MSTRKMQNWPFPGYNWSGPGSIDCLIEELVLNEEGTFLVPKIPLDLERDCGQLIWCCYDIPYPILLVDQVNQMLLSTPTATPGQPLVPQDLYESTWKQIQFILREYLQFHFSERPGSHPFDKHLKKCADIIGKIAKSFQKKPQTQSAILQELKNAASKVSMFHLENTRELESEAGLISLEDEESVTIRRPQSPPLISTESKTSADEAEENKKNAEKEKAHQRRAEQEEREKQQREQQEINYVEQSFLARQRDQKRFDIERGVTKEPYNQLGRGRFFPATSGRQPTLYRRPQAFVHPKLVNASRAVSAQDIPMSSTTVSRQDYNVNVLASSLLQKHQSYQPIRQPEIRRPFGAPTEEERRVPFINKDPHLQRSHLKTVEAMPRELPFVPQPTTAFLNETKYYSQVPLELNQAVTLRCPKLTENKQVDFEVNLSKFLQEQQTEESQSLAHILQNVNLKKIPKEMFVWLESIAKVLQIAEVDEENTLLEIMSILPCIIGDTCLI